VRRNDDSRLPGGPSTTNSDLSHDMVASTENECCATHPRHVRSARHDRKHPGVEVSERLATAIRRSDQIVLGRSDELADAGPAAVDGFP
jgi:hypothetical protein